MYSIIYGPCGGIDLQGELMKKIVALLAVAVLAAACLPKLPDLPEVPTLGKAELPVATDTEKMWYTSDYDGKPVLIVFMGSWCPWCKKTMPAISALHKKYGTQVEIVGAFADGTPGPVRDAVTEHGFTPTALYGAGELIEELGVSGFPHTILFDKKHRAIKIWEGYRPDMEEVVSVEIDKLVK